MYYSRATSFFQSSAYWEGYLRVQYLSPVFFKFFFFFTFLSYQEEVDSTVVVNKVAGIVNESVTSEEVTEELNQDTQISVNVTSGASIEENSAGYLFK